MKNKLFQFSVAGMLLLAATSCQKMDKPALGDYPKDSNPVGGPLKFFCAFNGDTEDNLRNAVDSIRANFPTVNSGTKTAGISGNAYQGNSSSFIQFGSANDFAGTTSFSIAFWMKKTPQAAGTGTNFAFALNAKDYSWTKLRMFFEFEDAGQSTTSAAACKFYLNDQWFEFTGAKAMANVLNGEWHHIAFTFDGETKKLNTYVDGAIPGNLPAGFGNYNGSTTPLFEGVTGLTIGGAGDIAKSANGWMGSYDGALDQFRLYGTALSAAEVQALFNGRQ